MGSGSSIDPKSPKKPSVLTIQPNNYDKPLGSEARYRERNPRFTMNIRDEPQQMLRPIEGYGREPLVSLEQACKPLEHYISDLPRNIWIAKRNSQFPPDGLTSDESAAIHLYTMEWSDSLYVALNKRLREADRRALKPWFLYLKLLLTALFKLPSIRGVVWRGVPDDLCDRFTVGSEHIWWSFSSCTTSVDILKNPMYLGNRGKRTLFSIEAFHGKAIQEHSFYKNENEVILLPGLLFEVAGNLDSGNNLHIIQLKQKRSPFPLLEPPFKLHENNYSAQSNASGWHKQKHHLFQQTPPMIPVQTSQESFPLHPPSLQPPKIGRLKKILFNAIPGSERNQDEVPNGYENLNWENFTYIEESYAHSCRTSQWNHIFKYSKYGIYNTNSARTMYIRSNKKGRTFTIVSIDAVVIDRSTSEWIVTGFKDNLKIYSKEVKFQRQGQYQLLELNYENIDEVKFETFNGFPTMFIGCINIIM